MKINCSKSQLKRVGEKLRHGEKFLLFALTGVF